MKSKKIIFMICLILFIVTLLPVFKGNNMYQSISQTISSKKYRSSLSEARQENYDKMKIDYINVKSRVTGTAPFNVGSVSDANGIDVSDKDNYVRTFDIVKYTLDLGISSNTNINGVTDASTFNGGVIKVRAKLPNQGNLILMSWEQDAWMKNVSYNEDKTEIYAEYHVPENVSVTNANQNLTFTVKVGGYKKEVTKDMAPVFEIWMEGNGPDDSTSEVKSIIATDTSDSLIISGKPSYDVGLKASTYMYNGVRNNLNGYYAAYGIGISLVQPEVGISDLRGVEYPTGDFVIELENSYLARNISGDNSNYINVDENSPESLGILNNTKVVAYGINDANNDNYYPNSRVFTRDLPKGKGGGIRAVNDSGNMNLSMDKTITTITFNDYKFNGKYPTNNMHSTTNVINFPGNIGYFATGTVQLFIPYYSEEGKNSYNYSYNLKIKSIKYNDSKGKTYNIANNDINSANNELGIGFSESKLKGNFYVQTMLNNNSETAYDGLSSSTLGGYVYPVFTLMPVDGPYKGGAERLITWNNNYFTLSKNNNDWAVASCNSEIGFNCPKNDTISFKYGVFKNDSENGLTTDLLVNSAKKDDFNWYDTVSEALEQGKISAIYAFDSDVVGNRVHRQIRLKFEVTSNPDSIGTVGTMVHRATIYADEEKSLVYTPYSDVEYIKTQYNKEGNVTKNHSPSTIGTSVLVLGAKTNIVTSVSDLDSVGELKKAYDVKDSEINVKLTHSITNDKPAQDNDKYLESVIVRSTLPNGLTYKVGSSNKEPKSVNVNEDGTTIIEWEYKDWQVNHQAPEFSDITYKASISAALDNNTSLSIISEILNKEDLRDSKFRTSEYGVVISNLSGSRAYTKVDKTVVDQDEAFIITNYISNTSQDALTNVRSLDILPKDDDLNGSDFNSGYYLKINSIAPNQKLYYTTNNMDDIGITKDQNDKDTIKDVDLENDSRWVLVEVGDILPKNATALASVISSVESAEEVSYSYEVVTDKNMPNDTYVFTMNVTSDNLSSAIKSNALIVKVVSRSISGVAFIDNNDNDIYDELDTLLSNTDVSLLDSNKNVIRTTKTDKNGNYVFDNLSKGNYYVEFKLLDKYIVIPKGNNDVSSKVDSNGLTDLINQDNKALSQKVSIDNINLGLKLKQGKVTIHHYIDGTNTSITDDVIKDYNYGDNYTTDISNNIPKNYELKTKTDNYKGVINSDNIEVIYYYKKMDSSINSKIEKNGPSSVPNKETSIDYTITSTYLLDNYIGNAEITVVDYLPYEIDVDNSLLDGGIYNNDEKTITWIYNWDNIDTYNNINSKVIINNIKLKYKDIEVRDITNKVESNIKLDNNEKKIDTSFTTKVMIPSTIVTHYYLEGTKDKLADSLLSSGFVGEIYNSEPKMIEGYSLKEKRQMYVYEEEEQEIIYEYRKIDNPATIDNIGKYIVISIGSILILIISSIFISKKVKTK